MDHVLTLIADSLPAATVDAARDALRRSGARLGEPDWLAPGTACDLPFAGLPGQEATAVLQEELASAAVDLFVQPPAGRRKSLLLADMESTVIKNEMLDELADFVGVRPAVEAITARAMNGEIDFKGALQERVALLTGLSQAVLDEARRRIVVDPGAAALVATLRAHGAYTVLVSGGFTCFAEEVGAALGFDEVRANLLEVEDGRLTGRVAEPILDRGAKLAALEELCSARRLEAAATVAVGDGANDLPMLERAGLGVAFHAKPAVARAAACRVEHHDLRALLYLQGYRAEELRVG